MMHYVICLILIGVVAGDYLAKFEKICPKDNNSGSGFTFQLGYDYNASALDLTVTSSYVNNLTSLKIHLYAKWGSDPIELPCHDDRFLLHTVREIPATAHNEVSMRLRYIYSGYYRLTVLPWVDSESSFSSETIHFLIRTTQEPIAIQNWTTQFTIHPIPHSSSIIIQFLPADDEYEFSHYEVILSSCDEVSSSTFSHHASICYANKTKPECTFEGLKAGQYCAFVRPIDSRCNFGYVWQVKDYCIVHSDIIELPLAANEIGWIPADSIIIKGNSKTYTNTILGTVVTCFLLITVLVGVMVYRLLGKRSQLNTSEGQKFSTLDTDSSCEFKQPLPKTVLFLWIQDEDGLAHQVKQLKSLLSTHCNAKVLDVYDDDLYDELSIDPLRWLSRTTSIKDLRIVIIGSNNLELLYNEALQVTGDELKRPGSLESLVLYAIQLVWLRKTVNHSLHSSTFFVRFSNNRNDYYLGELTPFRCFLLPAHQSELVFYLNN